MTGGATNPNNDTYNLKVLDFVGGIENEHFAVFEEVDYATGTYRKDVVAASLAALEEATTVAGGTKERTCIPVQPVSSPKQGKSKKYCSSIHWWPILFATGGAALCMHAQTSTLILALLEPQVLVGVFCLLARTSLLYN